MDGRANHSSNSFHIGNTMPGSRTLM